MQIKLEFCVHLSLLASPLLLMLVVLQMGQRLTQEGLKAVDKQQGVPSSSFHPKNKPTSV